MRLLIARAAPHPRRRAFPLDALRRCRGALVTGGASAAGMLAIGKNLSLLAVALPGHAMFGRFLWSFKQARDLYLVLLLPLNVLPIVLADLPSIRLLALLAIAAGSLQLFLSSRIRRFGLQFV